MDIDIAIALVAIGILYMIAKLYRDWRRDEGLS